MLALRDTSDEKTLSEADARIRANLVELPVFKRAKTVFCYVSVGSEVETHNLIKEMLAAGKTVCVPRCSGKRIMHAHVITDLDELEEGAFGIPAPAEGSPVIAPNDVDLIIVPCLACDLNGNRLGYGGGYYDSFFINTPAAIKVIVCRKTQLRESIPTEPHDIRITMIVTDEEVVNLN